MTSTINLETLDCTNIKEFSLEGYECDAKIIKVYDGDTVTVVFEYKNELHKWHCRLDGIDTPELKTKNAKEKDMGLKARDALREKILNKVVKLKCKSFDKYGRLLADIYYNNCKINQWLIDEKYAVGAKHTG